MPRLDRIFTRLLGKPFNTIYVPPIAAEENESFCASIQVEIDQSPKQDMLIIIDDWNTKVGNKENQMLLENLD